jgi:hypothetical protein
MSDLNCILIEDSRISNVTDKEVIGVLSGPSQSTSYNFAATSQSSSSLVWNVQIPSENILIDRHLLAQSTITLSLKLSSDTLQGFEGTDATANKLVFDYGLTDSLQSFPFTSLCTTQQMTINNCTVSQNTKDILPMLLRMYDRRKLNRYNSLCPSLPDAYYSEYKSGLGCLNNVLSGYNNTSLDEDFVPRGSFPVTIKNVLHKFTATPAGGVAGTYYNNSLVMEANTSYNSWDIVLQFTTTEPFICLSPWINSNSNNNAGLIGINNISCNFSIDGTCSRVFSTMTNYISSIALGATSSTMTVPNQTDPITTIVLNGNNIPAVTTTTAGSPIDAFQSSKLLFNFLSLQPEQYQKISSKNVVPYMDYPRYLSSQQSTTSIPAIALNASTGQITASSTTLTSQSLQLSQIPDLILISVRKPMSSQTWVDSSSFLTITNISVSFNNTAGILSSCNQQQLFNISYRNGSAQSYYEFCGFARNNYTGVVAADGNVTFSQELVGRGVEVGTTGSLLVLNPVFDFNLPSYLSSGSLGQYNLYFTITVTNQTSQIITNPEICIVCCNSGFFTSQLGSSVVNTGLLTKELVLRTKEQKPTMDSTDYSRYIGGNLSNYGLSNVYKLFNKHIKPILDDKLGEQPIINTSEGSGISGGNLRISRLKKHLRQ